jgi:branched-chain amino acid aminotransferase
MFESDFTREDLFTSDELFLTGTATNVAPVVDVDGRRTGTGEFPVTRKILHVYMDTIHGKLKQYEPWLTYVLQQH